jgi:uncharacterized membrane protein
MEYLVAKWLHVLSSTLLFGTGVGSAFYLLTAAWGRNAAVVAHVSRWVVRADWLFTATTAALQPLTGWWMLRLAGISLETGWVAWSIGLYALAIACWLAVVWLQMRMRDLAAEAAQAQQPLSPAFWRYFGGWVALGVPAFFAFLAVFWLMVAKPSVSL